MITLLEKSMLDYSLDFQPITRSGCVGYDNTHSIPT